MAKLMESPRHARDFESMLDALAIFVRPLQPTIGQETARLGIIAETMSQYNIVNEPMLGRYEGGTIISSLFPPTGGAAWDRSNCVYIGGEQVSTKVLTRLGHVIGSGIRDDDSAFPSAWKLIHFYRQRLSITIDCYVGPLIGNMASLIKEGSNKRKSASSYNSQQEVSQFVFLVDDVPDEHIACIAARGDRYAYILNNEKNRVVGFVGYAFLEVIRFPLRLCVWDMVTIYNIMA
jgi:hypothetical protein